MKFSHTSVNRQWNSFGVWMNEWARAVALRHSYTHIVFVFLKSYNEMAICSPAIPKFCPVKP